MTVKITKPALNLREELADLRKPSGIAGEALLRADSVQEQRDLLKVGRKNLIINGGFDVWQRGTSFTGAGYTTDRWVVSTSNSGLAVTKTANRDTLNTLRVTMAGVSCNLDQRIEGFGNVAYNQPVTLSFWVRGSASFNNFICRMRNHTTSTNMEDVNYSTTTSWTKVTKTFSASTSWSKDDACRLYVLVNNNVMSSGDWIEFSNVQLELGSVATEFEHRSYGEELALCQRYYEKPALGRITGYHNGTVRADYQFRTQKRATPSVTITNAVDSGGNSITLAASNITKDNMSMHSSCNASSGIQAQLEIDAEL